MHDASRIDLLSATETVPRQTPKNDFGEVVSKTLGGLINGGASLVRGALSAFPVVSTAVAGTQSVVSVAGGGLARSPSATANPLSALGLNGASGGLPGLDTTLQHLTSGAELSGGEYLVLQQAIQQENQQYTAVSNILKVRSDSAKAAINNIR